MIPTIIFHIGLEKTGTDSFQRFCKDRYRTLLGRGVLFPVNGLVFNGRNHTPVVACYLPYRALDMGHSRKSTAVLRALRREIDAKKPSVVVISAEHFSSRFRDDEIAQLARDFADFPCRIVAVVRDHASLIHSAYAQAILAARTLSFEEYCNELLHPDSRYVRYRDTIEPWEYAFGHDNMRVFTLGSEMNVVRVLCDGLIPQAAPPKTAISYWDNKSLGASGTEALRQVSMALPTIEVRHTGPMGQLKWLLLRIALFRLRDLIAATAGDRPQGRFGMSQHNRKRLQEIVEADQQWLMARYSIRLDQPLAGAEIQPDETLIEFLICRMKARPWVKLLMMLR